MKLFHFESLQFFFLKFVVYPKLGNIIIKFAFIFITPNRVKMVCLRKNDEEE